MQIIRTRWPVLIAPLGLLVLLWMILPSLHANYIGLLSWVYAEMQHFHALLAKKVGLLADNANPATALALIVVSFLYGVLHAAGPGHGKLILTTYLLTQPEKIKKSVMLAAASALVQGLVAILLVYGLFYLFGWVSSDMKNAVAWSERLAFSLIIGIGASLIYRGVKAVRASTSQLPADHDQGEHSCTSHHAHSDPEAVCSTCGHAHMPTGQQVEQATNWQTTLGVVLSIGMRPCAGAIVVLVFARFSGVSWAGVLAVLAMSIGTALTVSLLATASVSARHLAQRLLNTSHRFYHRIGYCTAIFGGVVLTFIGYTLLTKSFDAPMRSMGL